MKRIYLDYQATTPTDPAVVQKMLPYFSEIYGNAHSSSHSFGAEAFEAVEEARQQVAVLVGAESASHEIIFTSGATESNNLAIKGAAYYMRRIGSPKNHIITQKTEHKCVLASCEALEKEGFHVTYLSVAEDGRVRLEDIQNAITPQTFLVSIMTANNELGVIQPIEDIGALCEAKKVFFHTDAAQVFGKIPFSVQENRADLVSISAHKMYGPKGIGALYIRRRNYGGKERVRLDPLLSGGGQERGFRSGTIPVPLCVGLGEAARLAVLRQPEEYKRLQAMRDRFWNTIKDNLDYVALNGSLTHRLPHNLNIRFSFVEGESLMLAVPHLALSSGSACTSASLEGSYVINALGGEEDAPHSSLRISFGRQTTEEDARTAAHDIIAAVRKLRKMSPLYEMVVEKGVSLKNIHWSH